MCLTNLIVFCDEMAPLVEKVYSDASKAFDTVTHSILTDKLLRYALDLWTTRWLEKLLGLSGSEGCDQRCTVQQVAG